MVDIDWRQSDKIRLPEAIRLPDDAESSVLRQRNQHTDSGSSSPSASRSGDVVDVDCVHRDRERLADADEGIPVYDAHLRFHVKPADMTMAEV